MKANDPKKLLTDLGKRIAEIRISRGLSQEDYADELDVNTRYVQSVEGGRENLSVRNLARFADQLRVPVRELFSMPTTTKATRVPRRKKKRQPGGVLGRRTPAE